MIRIRAAVFGLMLGGCAHSSLVLLPDDDGGHGSVAVLEASGNPSEAVIGQGNSRTRLGDPTPASRPLGKKGLKASEAALLAGLPPPPRSFTLYFDQGTITPTAESAPVLNEIRTEIAARSGAAVEVTGHTDAVGSEEDNDRLSTQRAEQVLGWLVSHGFDRSMMSAVGRGERELKVPTADDVANSANRRVEIIVR